MFILPHLKGLVAGNVGSAAFKNAALDLKFASNKSLVDSISGNNLVSFTRASSATFVDSSGVLRSAVTNLLLQSEDFSTTWFLTSATLSANAIAAPNGTLTAEQLIEAATTANHEVGQTFASPVNNATYTLSCYLKAATSTTCGIRFSNGLNGTGIICSVDLTAQTATVTAGTGTATIANVGSGWFRVSLTATASGTPASTTVSIFRSIGTAGSTANSVYIWGAQLEQASTVGEYIPTTSTINSAPRFDHNPTTGESLGLLVEEARTNFVLESEAFSTGWLIGAFTTSTAAVTSPSGQSSALSAKETSASNSQHLVAYLLNIPATTPYSFSVFVKPNGGNNISLRYYFADNNWIARIFSLTGTGSVTQSNAGASADVTNISASVVPYSNGWYRISLTLTQPSSRGAYFSIDGCTSSTPTLVSTSGIEVYTGDVNRGYYLWGAQLEAGAFATSYIPTTSATVTRAADVASITGSNFSSWYNQTEGTVFAEGNSYGFSASTFPTFAGISDGTANNRLQYAYITQASGGYLVASGGAFVVELYPNSAINPRRAAFAAAANNYAVSYNGASPTVDTAGNMPTGVNQMQIGNLLGAGATNNFFGTIKRLVYWGQRLPNTTLQQITQP